MSNPGPAGYDVVLLPQPGEGRPRQGAKFTCARCEATIIIPLPSGRLNPEMLARRAIQAGWRADAFHPSKCRCPEHNPKANAMNKKTADLATDMRTLAEIPERLGMPSAPPVPAQVVARPLTTDEKFNVRQLLDKHFDDSRGIYLDGFSDKKIGETLNIPWKAVAEMREVGWGPVRANPELDELKAEMVRFRDIIDSRKRDVAAMQKSFDLATQAMEEGLMGVQERLLKLEG